MNDAITTRFKHGLGAACQMEVRKIGSTEIVQNHLSGYSTNRDLGLWSQGRLVLRGIARALHSITGNNLGPAHNPAPVVRALSALLHDQSQFRGVRQCSRPRSEISSDRNGICSGL